MVVSVEPDKVSRNGQRSSFKFFIYFYIKIKKCHFVYTLSDLRYQFEHFNLAGWGVRCCTY